MKKIVAIILTLTLVAALLVTPAFAAENAVYASVRCPRCNDGTLLTPTSTGRESIYTSKTVGSCDYFSSSHSHVFYRMEWLYVCKVSCAYTTYVWDSSTSRIFCGSSNMWLGVGIVDEIM